MLSRRYRLTRPGDIRNVLRHGLRVTAPHVTLYLLTRSGEPTSRAACVVAKRVHASAVRRHQYQRWLRAALRPLLPQLARPYDIVVTAAPTMSRLKSSQGLREELAGALCRQLL